MKRLPACLLPVVAAGLVAATAFVPSASASQVISTSTVTGLTLQVNNKGEALLTYTSAGKKMHVLVWGAENAIATTPGKKQVAFQLDYSGGYQKYFKNNPVAQKLAGEFRRIKGKPGYLISPITKKLQQVQQAADNYWKTAFHGGCAPYDGPTLAWSVATCKASDGSYWAVQEWQRKLPDYGLQPTGLDAAYEVHLSHWTGALPVLTVGTDWSWHKWNHLYGTFTYDGAPVFGLASTASGQPLDTFGRNLYVDTFDSAYGTGWKRENSFLTHKGDGVFCYSVNPHGDHPAGTGTEYRATIMGPGVTPDVMWTGLAPGAYDGATDAQRNLAISGLHDALCQPN
ncbi:MAG TPA: hypothetical protein VG265_10540 [Gaiellaceae bacterium]|jgi:hypothetical protein|nr:hypothetical protein [Gaiellaceae bacterium]